MNYVKQIILDDNSLPCQKKKNSPPFIQPEPCSQEPTTGNEFCLLLTLENFENSSAVIFSRTPFRVIWTM
jgi:hypothetical protein